MSVSDGSYDAHCNKASASYTLLDSTGQHGFECSMDVPGDASCQNAYRAEVAGIVGAIFLIQLSIYVFRTTQGKVAVYCDGKSALEQVFDFPKEVGTAKSKQLNLIMAARKVIKNIDMTLDHHHVKGHQDDEVLLERLPLPAQINVHMDQRAKRHLRTTLNRTTHSPLDKSHPDGPISVYYNKIRIFDNLSSNLYDVISNQRLVDYWVHICRFPAEYQETIIVGKPSKILRQTYHLHRSASLASGFQKNVESVLLLQNGNIVTSIAASFACRLMKTQNMCFVVLMSRQPGHGVNSFPR